ncbi:MAG: alpha/beta hydrolase [Janthinobacterium lividum]
MPKAPQTSDGTLTARPAPPTEPAEPGLHPLELAEGLRDGRLYIPPGVNDEPKPLIVLLHGAGGDGSSMLRLMGKAASNCVLLAPDARTHTWDFLNEAREPDVPFLDRALAHTFKRCRIDPSRIAIAGFSDGASYALTLGLANGDLFTHVIAFSPGFMGPPRFQGSPRIFLSHGTADEVLPIDLCSRRIVPQLKTRHYDLTYREFPGPHTVPDFIQTEAMHWLLPLPWQATQNH